VQDTEFAPVLSVVIPSLNHAKFIRRAIDSVLGQDYPPVELIVVDGGSADGTLEILAEYGARFGPRFRWVSEPDSGQSEALNKGIQMARGAFLGWQNSDDYYLPGAFVGPVAVLEASPEISVVYGEREEHDAVTGRVRRQRSHRFDYGALLEQDYIPSQAAFIRRSSLLDIGGVATDLHFAMDYDLWLRMGLRFKIQCLPGVRGVWNALPAAKTVSASWRSATEHAEALERAMRDPAFPDGLQSRAGRWVRRHALMALLESVMAGQSTNANEMLRVAQTHNVTDADWDYACGRLLLGRMRLDTWRQGEARRRLEGAPALALALLRSRGVQLSLAARHLAELHYVFMALKYFERKEYRAAFAFALRATTTAPVWFARTFAESTVGPFLEFKLIPFLAGFLHEPKRSQIPTAQPGWQHDSGQNLARRWESDLQTSNGCEMGAKPNG